MWRESDTLQYSALVAAALRSTAGHAPRTGPIACERAKAPKPATVSVAAVLRPSLRSQVATQTLPQTASTNPPSGRESLATATP